MILGYYHGNLQILLNKKKEEGATDLIPVDKIKPRQNKYSRHPNQNTTYDGTINAENTLRYNKINKKKENTTNNSYLNKKKKSLMQPRPNISRLSNEQYNDNSLNNPYLERLYSTDSKNPDNRLL